MEKWSAQDVCDRGDKAFKRFWNWYSLCQTQAEIFYPERADFTVSTTYGNERFQHIFDGEPILMRQNLANQLGVLLRGDDWFRAKAFPKHLNDIDVVKYWLEDATETLQNILYAPRAQFVRAMRESDNDYVTFGASVLRHTLNADRTGVLFACEHLRDHAWCENAEGEVDEDHAKMKKPVRHFASMFGADNLPGAWKELLEKDATQEVELRRCIMPIERYAHGKAIPRQAKFAAIYVDPVSKKEIAQTWFKVFPFVVRRWLTVSGEPFARSPCTGVALADARMLQQAQINLIEAMELIVRKPLIAPNDGVVGDVVLRAGGINYYDPDVGGKSSRAPIDTLDVGEPSYGMEFAKERREFIGRTFFQHLFELPSDREMTAFETRERLKQIARNAGPIIQPMEAENALLLEGVFQRAFDEGAFTDPPEELQGAEVRFEFETPVTQAKRELNAEKAASVMERLGMWREISPDVIDNADTDQIVRDAMEGMGSMKWIAPTEVRDAQRKARAEAQAQEQAAAAAIQLASTERPKRPLLEAPKQPGVMAGV